MNDARKRLNASKTLIGPLPSFDPDRASEAPHTLFLEWFQTALDHGVKEPHTMTLSTVDEEGLPDARVLILKDIDEHGWYFGSSAKSPKGKQIERNSGIALTFYWPVMGRQVRVRGKAIPMNEEQSATDFLNRSQAARAVALTEKQSSVLQGPSDFERAFKEQLNRVQQNPEIVSPTWTLYRVMAQEVEFWQGNEDRKHSRLIYTRDGNHWVKNLLWP